MGQNDAMIIIRLIGTALSTIGYWETIKNRTKINLYYIPSLTIAIQVNVLLICGVLNLLLEGTCVLFLFGIAAFLNSVREKKMRFDIWSYCNSGFFFFGITLFIMAIFLKGRVFLQYDNFSHWALVVKRMIDTNRYPTFQDVLISFQEYPLGSSSFLYYFAKTVGSAREAVLMFAQLYIMLCCILPLFSFVGKNKVLGTLLIVFATNFFWTYNIDVTSLPVDTLLPLIGMCGIMFTVSYCGNDCDWRSILFATCYASFLVQVKNSGIFFAGLICLWIIKNASTIRASVRFTSIFATMISLVLWHKHCDYVFLNARLSRHALTVDYGKQTFINKSLGEKVEIGKAMIEFAIKWKDIWIVLLLFVVLGIIIRLLAKTEFALYKKALFSSICLYFFYQVGMLGMYLFFMPRIDALNLAGHERYAKTIIVAIMYLLTAVSIKTLSALHYKNIQPLLIFSSVILPFILLSFSTGEARFVLTYTPTYLTDPEERGWLESAIEDYGVPCGESYCILIPRADSGYAYYLGRYLLQSDDVSSVVATDDNLTNIHSKYIFVYDKDNEFIQSWIANNYPGQENERVVIVE